MRTVQFVTIVSLFMVTMADEDAAYWRRVASDDITRYLDQAPNTNIAKKVILFIGDGMGLSTVMAARVLKGQQQGNPGEETKLAFETLPNVGLSKVYTVNAQVPDSAATATAILTGVKTISRVIGLDNKITYDVCENITNAKLTTMLHWSQAAGKSTGIVSTARITHATPAAAYAQVPNRNWENDHELPEYTDECTDIADQLIRDNHDINVILGGGGRNFVPVTMKSHWTGEFDKKNHRLDGRNLIGEWEKDKIEKGKRAALTLNKGTFDEVDPAKIDYLLGIFSESHMDYELERSNDPERGQPSIADMTKKSIQILQKNQKGFFLLVEGGRIDHGHHETSAKKALYDTIAFDDAVKTAMDMTDEKETLLIVTADHSHVMTVAGYAKRGNGILDIARPSVDNDSLPYTTLSYANGPNVQFPRQNLTLVDTAADKYRQIAAIPMDFETHSGEDVAIYSRGPMSHLLTGVKEQNVIAYVMAHAACVGNTGISCSKGRPEFSESSSRQRFDECKGHLELDSANKGGQLPRVNCYIHVIIISIYFLCFLK